MVVFDNIIFSLQKAGGISVVWKNLLSEYSKVNNNYCVIEYDNYDKNIFRQQLNIPLDKIEFRHFFVSEVFEQLLNVKTYGIDTPFIFHSSYYRICKNKRAKNITTVHDFIYEKGYIKVGVSERIRLWQNYRAIKNSDKIVCISNNTRKDLFRYLPDIDENKVSVIYNGVSDDYRILKERPYPYDNYVLFVGGRQAYKNFEFVVKSIKKSKYNLLVCGNELLPNEKILLSEVLGNNRYKFILRPSNEELNKIYNSVYCLIYPSEYEGFGIPVLEAQRAGCPVIALNSSSIPEIIGEGGLLLSEINYSEILSLINSISFGANRELLVKSGLRNSQKYSWGKMASEYNCLYNSL